MIRHIRLRKPDTRLLLAGAACWALACGVHFALQPARLQHKAELQAPALAVQPRLSPPSPEQLAAAWRQQLPAAAVRQERLADLLEISVQLGLATPRTEHRLWVNRDAGLERLSVTMPVKGSYAQLRQFLGAALVHDPALSLDSLRLRRINAQANEVEAELQWSLHARAAEASR